MSSDLEGALGELWLRSRDEMLGRLATVEQAALTLRSAALEDAVRHDAQRAAHQLAGSLGIFGFEAPAALARQLEQLLRAVPQPATPQATRLRRLAAELRRAVERATDRPAAARSTVPVRPPQRSRATILLADDDDSVAKMIETALGRAGHQVVRARDGAETIELLDRQPFDLVLLDLQMPVLDGFATCRALRADPRHARLPIVLLSAQSDEESIRTGFADGATDFLIKPFSVSMLRTRVEMWLLRTSASANAQPPLPPDGA